jgi:nucleotide-binding universal stress UspA family protein
LSAWRKKLKAKRRLKKAPSRYIRTVPLPYAESLARRYGGTLVIVYSEDAPSHGATLAEREELKDRLVRLADELRDTGLDVRTRIVSDPTYRPAHRICEVAEEMAADVIVAGTRGRSLLAGVVVGSVTQRLLHLAPCPVLAVPPD